jgi:hypothetical protein
MDESVQHFQVNEAGFLVEALWQRLGNDYLLSVWGGDAHIGAVAMAQPRPSLADPDCLSATASVFCYVGHKEDELVKKVSEKLASALGTKVIVVAGLHWDNLNPTQIERIVKNVFALVEMILRRQQKGIANE